MAPSLPRSMAGTSAPGCCRCSSAASGREVFRVLRLALTRLFSIIMIKASFDLALLTSGQLTPALQISASWAYAACAVGFAGLATVSVAAIFTKSSGMSVGLAVLFGVFIAAVLIDAPIAIALGIASIAYILVSDTAPLMVAAQRTVAGLDSFTLLAIPLFVLPAASSPAPGLRSASSASARRWLAR